ncbi:MULTISPECIES: GFA family protein [Francisella]|uniref:GFA family protein n=1 Tax=Francisella opportunistica TaxID=2016517 RepID=A0A345JR65_9GAMM|nr:MULTISPECIES: GFA family protein [Francisella]APC91530.1 Gfa-like protein [Francisella sp. MA067296]AXH29811.1 GFA family protein [Francisella opportunistica]AXH31461.1 aldehyde-activating protein [Francisella opportunistica]AXH33107.1 aldehyde-activating protein [Francisella opportunistica]
MSKKYKSTCHCKAIELELYLPNGLEKLRRCNCSICSRKGAVVSSVSLENLKIIRGEDMLTKYTFGTHTAEHYFCSVCGIYTHHKRRSNPNEYGINVACIDGVDIENFKDIKYLDGKNNHPADK